MPRENKKRGRRAGEKKKRKLDVTDAEEPEIKRQKPETYDEPAGTDYIPLDFDAAPAPPTDDAAEQGEALDGATQPGEQPFYGMLDEAEQELFKKADEELELNMFETPDERESFLTNLYREAEGKELKLANSQSCSRLMERLIQLSSASQLKQLFTKFSGNFTHLLQHRFASHCCEALFIKAAPAVTIEMQTPLPKTDKKPTTEPVDPEEEQTMETHFMNTLNELEEYLGYFMTHKWGSHALRILLLVLAGEPVTRSTRKGPLNSKRKEKVSVVGGPRDEETLLEKRAIPDTFTAALEIMITKCVQGLNTDFLRALAQHPTGNPTMQLLLQMELTKFGKQRAKDENSLMHKLLPDDPIAEGTGSAGFVNGLIYDAVGSRLLETIIEFAPAKTFKTIWQDFFKPRLATLARNDVATYVVMKVLTRLSGDDIKKALEELLPQMEMLVERNRTALIRTLVDRATVRNVPTDRIAKSIELAYHGENGFDPMLLLKLVEVAPPTDQSQNPTAAAATKAAKASTTLALPPASERLHGSLLAQSMIASPGPLSELIYTSLSGLSAEQILKVARDPSAAHAITAALSNPQASIIHRRKIIQLFYGHVAELAVDLYGSRVVDSIWDGTAGLAFIRERIAEELAEAEATLRESGPGRKVWRNWKMDLYRKRRRDWIMSSRESAGRSAFVGFPEDGATNGDANGQDSLPGSQSGKENKTNGRSSHDRKARHGKDRVRDGDTPASASGSGTTVQAERHLTALEKARQKHAQEKARKEREAAKKEKDKAIGSKEKQTNGAVAGVAVS